MSFLTIILFFVIMWGLGHGLTRIINPPTNLLEREFLRLGVGIGVFSVLAIILNLLHIPLHWLIFLILSLISPSGAILRFLRKRPEKPKLGLTTENIFFLLAVLVAIVHLVIFLKGAFIYPYLENGDPWDHSRSIRYIASQKTAFEPSTSGEVFKFMDAYPPTFDILMAIMYQVSDEMIWTLKFFNALLISLTFIFFFMFCKKMTKDPIKAFLATTILLLVPSYMSHFIWALTMSMVLFLPSLYALESIQDDKRWKYIAGVMIGALLVSQPSMAVVMSFMIFLYWGVRSIIHKNMNKGIIMAAVIGIVLSMAWWGAVYYRWGSPTENEWAGVYSPNMVEDQRRIGEFSPGFRIIGTADRVYTFGDFFFARFPNMINNPIGVGSVLSILLGISLIFILFNVRSLFTPGNEWKVLCIVLLIFTFLGIHGARLPVQFIAFRFWMLFAIPLSFLVGGVLIEMIGTKSALRVVLIFLVLVGIAITSGIPKYKINTATWYPSYFGIPEEIIGYSQFSQQVPNHQKIYSACPDTVYKLAAYDQDECIWCPQDTLMRTKFINETPGDIHQFLKSESYKYLLLDLSCFNYYDDWELQVMIKNLVSSNLFDKAYSFDGILMLSPK